MADVCYVTKTWRSGAAWVAQQTVQAIADQGIRISFIAPASEPASREPASSNLTRIVLPREDVRAVGRVQRIAASLSRVIGGLVAVLRERRHTRTFIFAIPDPLVFTIPLFILLRLSGAKIIFVVHDVMPHAWKFSGFMRRVEQRSHLLSYALSNRLVVLSRSLSLKLIDQFGFDARKIVVIPHGPFEIGAVSSCPGDGRFFTFGTFRRNKSILETIEAVLLARRTDPEVTLTLAGEAHAQEPEYWQECLAAIGQCPEAFDLKEGFLPDSELPAYVARIDAFILAYREFSSQSGVGILAAFSQRPVIGTGSGGLSELYDAVLCGVRVQEPVTAATIAAAILAFRATPIAEWRAQASVAVESLSATISWQAIGASYCSVIKNAR